METILSIRGLSVEYTVGKKIYGAVSGLSLDIFANDSLAVVGESGCGKTTLGLSILNILPREARISGGEIVFRGKNILALEKNELTRVRGGKIGMIFQDPLSSLNPVIRIDEQLRETLKAHGRDFSDGKIEELLAAVQLAPAGDIMNSYPHQLSGGMRQRIMIAQALCSQPEILVADEPTTALDVTTQKEILELLKKLVKEFNLTLVFITHNFNIIAGLCERLAVMYAGEIVEEGGLKEIFGAPRHPYTGELLSIMPDIDSVGGRFNAIAGEAPDLSNLPAGCRFSPRCPRRIEKCLAEHPLLETAAGRKFRCFNPVP